MDEDSLFDMEMERKTEECMIYGHSVTKHQFSHKSRSYVFFKHVSQIPSMVLGTEKGLKFIYVMVSHSHVLNPAQALRRECPGN